MSTTETLQPQDFLAEHSEEHDYHDIVQIPYYLHRGQTDLKSAPEVIEKIRVELGHLDEEIRDHRYLKLLRKRRIDLPSLRAFPGHQYHIIHSDLRSVAMMIHRFTKPSVQAFFAHVLQGEVQALTNIQFLGKKLGMSTEELQHYPIVPEGFAYATYMGWLSMYGSASEIVAGFLVNFSAWGYNCGQMSQALKDQYGFVAEDTVFLDAFANLPSFESTALQIIQDEMDAGMESWKILRAAFLFQGYEKMFWDTMAKLGTL